MFNFRDTMRQLEQVISFRNENRQKKNNKIKKEQDGKCISREVTLQRQMKHEHKQDKDGIVIRKEISGWALSLGLKTSHWDSSGI